MRNERSARAPHRNSPIHQAYPRLVKHELLVVTADHDAARGQLWLPRTPPSKPAGSAAWPN